MSGCAGWSSINPLCRAGQLLGGAAKAVGSDVFGAIADYFAGAAAAAVTWLWDQLDNATSLDLASPGIKGDLIATGAIAGLICFALFLVQVIGSVMRQDPGGLGRAVRGLGVAFIGAAFAIGSTQLLLAAVDGLCKGVVQFALGTDVKGMGTKLVVTTTFKAVGNPAGLLLLSLVMLLSVVVIWVALMIRKMLIIISAVFAPVAFAGAASDATRSWVRRWVELTVALVFSKLILVIIFMIGLSVLNGGGDKPNASPTTSVTNLCVGALTLLLAGFAPWLAIKMVHFAGESMHTVHAQAGAVHGAGRTAVAAPRKIATVAAGPGGFAKAAGAGAGPAAGSGAAAGAGASADARASGAGKSAVQAKSGRETESPALPTAPSTRSTPNRGNERRDPIPSN